MAMVAGRAGQPQGRAKPREDDVRRRWSRRPPGGARRRGRAGVDDDSGVAELDDEAGRGSTTRSGGVDDDGDAAELDVAGRGRDDEIDVVDRKVEDEQRNRSIYI